MKTDESVGNEHDYNDDHDPACSAKDDKHLMYNDTVFKHHAYRQ